MAAEVLNNLQSIPHFEKMMKNFYYRIYRISNDPPDRVKIKTHGTWQLISVRILLLMIMTYSISCQTGKQPEISDYRLQLGDLESIIQTGNWFKFYTDRRADPYTGTLNPGRMSSKGREYYILKFINHDKNFPFNLEDGDTLSFILDGRSLHLTGYNINKEQNRLSAYYEIKKWDLADIGNASNVKVIIKAQEGALRTSFTTKNIYNYRYFSAKYILRTDDIPPSRSSLSINNQQHFSVLVPARE